MAPTAPPFSVDKYFPAYVNTREARDFFRGSWATLERELTPTFLAQIKTRTPVELPAAHHPLFFQRRCQCDDSVGPDYVSIPVLVNEGPAQRIYVDLRLPKPKMLSGTVFGTSTRVDDHTLAVGTNDVVAEGDLVYAVAQGVIVVDRVDTVTHVAGELRVRLHGALPATVDCAGWIMESEANAVATARDILKQHAALRFPAPFVSVGVGGNHQEPQYQLFSNTVRVTSIIDGNTSVVVNPAFYSKRRVAMSKVFVQINKPSDPGFAAYNTRHPIPAGVDRFELTYDDRPLGYSIYLGRFYRDDTSQYGARCKLYVEQPVVRWGI
jgi:hypothetical protein